LPTQICLRKSFTSTIYKLSGTSKQICLRKSFIDDNAILDSLKNATIKYRIVALNLSDKQIGPDGAKSLAGVLPQCKSLTHLNLRYNQIGDTETKRLTEVLAQYSTLTQLDLRYN
jgi:Ran GTPase-activating protein (RanGAP) involved in mRNA processing and transport